MSLRDSLNETTVEQLFIDYRPVLIKELTAIEGVAISLVETEEIINAVENNPNVEFEERDALISRNLAVAFNYLMNTACNSELSIFFIKKLNSIVGKSIIDGCGKYRIKRVGIRGCSYRPPLIRDKIVNTEMEKILEENSGVDLAIEIYLYLTKTQLFLDGNKRTAMLAANWVLYHDKIGLLKIENSQELKENLFRWYEYSDTSIRDYLRSCIVYV